MYIYILQWSDSLRTPILAGSSSLITWRQNCTIFLEEEETSKPRHNRSLPSSRRRPLTHTIYYIMQRPNLGSCGNSREKYRIFFFLCTYMYSFEYKGFLVFNTIRKKNHTNHWISRLGQLHNRLWFIDE